jgi:hypothetical protein
MNVVLLSVLGTLMSTYLHMSLKLYLLDERLQVLS